VARIGPQIAQIYTNIVKTTKTTGTTAGNGSRERTAYKPAENGLTIATKQPRKAAYSNKPAEKGCCDTAANGTGGGRLVLGVEVGGFAFVFWGALFEEGADAFEVVVALIDAGAVGIDALEALGGEDGGCLAEDAELALDGADGHDAVATQWGKEMFLEESVEFLGGGDAIDESHVKGIVGGDGLSEKEHLACLVDAELVDEMHDARGVVRDAYLSRSDGKGGIVAADNHIAREAQVAGASPHRTVDTGDDGDRRFLYAA